jgi:fumarate hydratase subunit beta
LVDSGEKMNSPVITLSTPLDRESVRSLRAGDRVHLSGRILVFRDQVHRLLCGLIERGESLPFPVEGEAVYYCGPTAPRHGMAVGSAGPTTSSRMDPFTGPLLDHGLAMMIGKGNRSESVRELIRTYGAAYLVATGGAGALMAKHVVEAEVIAYPELGPESARCFVVADMPLIVGIDARGVSAFV